jgi:hypothetical protein
MALANVAALLAKWGKQVLVVDWDLEAPGLERYFQSVLPQEIRARTPGMIDLILAHERAHSSERRDVKESRMDWHECVIRAHLFKSAPPVSIITAGQDLPTYPETVQRIDWAGLIKNHELGPYLNELREQWLAEYDIVMIDSRTGISDIGGICTIILPDVLVLFFGTNEQSLKGVAEVTRRARAAQDNLPVARGRLIAVPVLGREESQTAYEQTEHWKDRIASEMDEFYRDWLWREVTPRAVLRKLYIPYWAHWSFGERLPVVEKPDEVEDPNKIGSAYARLALLINNQLDWKALGTATDPHELEEKKAEVASATRRGDEILERLNTYKVTARRRTIVIAASVFAILLVAAVVVWLSVRPKPPTTEDLLRQLYATDTPPPLRLKALSVLRNRSELDLEKLDLSKMTLKDFNLSKLVLRSANLSGAQLQGANLNETDLSNANLTDANLTNARLHNAVLNSANLQNADLEEAQLNSATLHYADLSGANLYFADLDGAMLLNTDLRGAELRGANINMKQIKSAQIDANTMLPKLGGSAAPTQSGVLKSEKK